MKDFQNFDVKSLSLSEIISFGMPCLAYIVSINRLANYLAMIVTRYARK